MKRRQTPRPSSDWKLGHLVVTKSPRRFEGQAIERTDYSLMILTATGERIWSGTEGLDEPTGTKWRQPVVTLTKTEKRRLRRLKRKGRL